MLSCGSLSPQNGVGAALGISLRQVLYNGLSVPLRSPHIAKHSRPVATSAPNEHHIEAVSPDLRHDHLQHRYQCCPSPPSQSLNPPNVELSPGTQSHVSTATQSGLLDRFVPINEMLSTEHIPVETEQNAYTKLLTCILSTEECTSQQHHLKSTRLLCDLKQFTKPL